jgi:hypothetical protein
MAVKYSRATGGTLMRVKFLAFFVSAAVFSVVSAPISAHHGAVSYDSKKFTTLKGTVTDFKFINPHTEIMFDVNDASGKPQSWIAEGVSATTLSRAGWNKNLLKAGDQITITGNALKNGSHAMRLSKVVLPSGRELSVERGEDYTSQ